MESVMAHPDLAGLRRFFLRHPGCPHPLCAARLHPAGAAQAPMEIARPGPYRSAGGSHD